MGQELTVGQSNVQAQRYRRILSGQEMRKGLLRLLAIGANGNRRCEILGPLKWRLGSRAI